MISIVKKELMDSMRDQRTLWLSIALPVAVVFLMMFFMGNGGDAEDMVVGVEGDVPEEMITFFDEMLVEWNFQEESDSVTAVREGEVDIGIHREEDEMIASGNMTNSAVSFGIQELMQQWAIYGEVYRSSILAEVGLSESDLIPINFDTQSISGEDNAQLTYFLAFIMIITVLSGAFPAAVDLFAGEKEKQTMESILMTPVSRLQIVIAKWIVITMIGTLSGLVAIFSILLFITSLEPSNMQIDWTTEFIWQLPVLAIAILLFAMLCASIMVMISIMTDSFKEAQNYFSPVMFLILAGPIAFIQVSPSQMVDWFFLIPSFNISAIVQSLLDSGSVSMLAYTYTILSSFVLAIIIFIIATKMFANDRWALGKS